MSASELLTLWFMYGITKPGFITAPGLGSPAEKIQAALLLMDDLSASRCGGSFRNEKFILKNIHLLTGRTRENIGHPKGV